ncbi:hypothetical protein [Cohnella lupini]|uniref:Uncharacterized protein n=1 Tax=Cohnella lupini TaxID=1294267 RepID=A0A3D9HQT6_9BACL|nr:hypothetical protein [Cohnella lupini]RED51809.1 hypothetical protein DFP95_13832 [Cohnella lupini]
MRGNWTVTVPVKKAAPIAVVEPKIKHANDKFSLDIEKIVFSKLATELNLSYKAMLPDATFGLLLTDENGQQLDDDTIDSYIVSNTAVSSRNISLRLLLKPIDEGTKRIKVKLFYYMIIEIVSSQNIDVTMTEMPTKKNPLILPQNKKDLMKITEIEYLKNKTVVHMLRPESLLRGPFSIIDEDGNPLAVIGGYATGNDYVMEYEPIQKDKKITFRVAQTPEIHYIYLAPK